MCTEPREHACVLSRLACPVFSLSECRLFGTRRSNLRYLAPAQTCQGSRQKKSTSRRELKVKPSIHLKQQLQTERRRKGLLRPLAIYFVFQETIVSFSFIYLLFFLIPRCYNLHFVFFMAELIGSGSVDKNLLFTRLKKRYNISVQISKLTEEDRTIWNNFRKIN